MDQIETLAELSAARPLRRYQREISALGGKTVHFRELDGDALHLVLGIGRRAATAQAKKNPDGSVSFDFSKDEMVELLSHALCNSEGELIAAGETGMQEIKRLHWKALNELFNASLEALGMSAEAVEEKKDG